MSNGGMTQQLMGIHTSSLGISIAIGKGKKWKEIS